MRKVRASGYAWRKLRWRGWDGDRGRWMHSRQVPSGCYRARDRSRSYALGETPGKADHSEGSPKYYFRELGFLAEDKGQ